MAPLTIIQDQDAPPDWLTQAAAELDQIVGRHAAKKRATILAVVEASTTPGVSVETVWDSKHVCARSTYYGKWLKDPLFRRVLDNVTAVKMQHDAQNDLLAMKDRRVAWQNRVYKLAEKMLSRADDMFMFPLMKTTIDNGQTVIEPGRWNLDTAIRMIAQADKLGRLSLGMPTDKRTESRIDIDLALLTDIELDRLAAGEEILDILADRPTG